MNTQRRQARKNSGNMLILVSVFMAVAALFVLCASSLGSLFFEHSRLQNSANEIALAGARKLNENDRLGQMNNMIGRCRQLVYCSTDTYAQVDTTYAHLRHLAEQLAEESRDSAADMETERHLLAELARNEAQITMTKKFNEIKVSYPMSLPWLKVEAPTLESIVPGKLADVQSNVMEMKGFSELESHDVAQGYLKVYPDLKLYKEHIDARLPAPDNALRFKLASLAAPVGDSASSPIISSSTTVAPARAALAKKFRTIDDDELPSACQVTIDLKIGATLGASTQDKAEAIGTAAATGGGLPL